MASSSPPPYFQETPDLSIPIPNTSKRLALTWEHTRAIQKLSRFFARLYTRTQNSEDKTGLEKYKSWMVTLFQMNASIHEGTTLSRNQLLTSRVSATERRGHYMPVSQVRGCAGGFSRGPWTSEYAHNPRNELHSRVQRYRQPCARN